MFKKIQHAELSSVPYECAFRTGIQDQRVAVIVTAKAWLVRGSTSSRGPICFVCSVCIVCIVCTGQWPLISPSPPSPPSRFFATGPSRSPLPRTRSTTLKVRELTSYHGNSHHLPCSEYGVRHSCFGLESRPHSPYTCQIHRRITHLLPRRDKRGWQGQGMAATRQGNSTRSDGYF